MSETPPSQEPQPAAAPDPAEARAAEVRRALKRLLTRHKRRLEALEGDLAEVGRAAFAFFRQQVHFNFNRHVTFGRMFGLEAKAPLAEIQNLSLHPLKRPLFSKSASNVS